MPRCILELWLGRAEIEISVFFRMLSNRMSIQLPQGNFSPPCSPRLSQKSSPPTFVQRLVDEISCRVEVGAHVEGRRVVGLDAQVADARALVVLGAPPPLAVRGVEDVGDAQVSQLPPVGRYISIQSKKQRRDA